MSKYLKRDCMSFLEKVERKALRSVSEKYEELYKERRRQIFVEKGYLERIQKIQMQINVLASEHEQLVLDLSDDKEIRYQVGKYGSLENRLRVFESKYLESILEGCKLQDKQLIQVEKQKEKELQEVRDNYATVRNISGNMTSGNKAAEYLIALGFDLSSIENKEDSTALLAKVDTDKLFVCGSNS